MNKFLIILSVVIFSTATVAKQSYELGGGYNYGGLVGFTVNQEISSNVEIFGGLGVGMEAAGYVVGTKFWINDNARLTMNYGTNCSILSSTWTDYEGLNFGIGYSFTGKNAAGWAFDLMLLDVSDCNAATTSISSDSAIRLALGYRF